MMASLKQQRYADIAEVARMADGVAKLLHGEALRVPGTAKAATAQASQKPKEDRRPSSTSRTRGSKLDYPRFERDADRLIKIAWSKKHREEYEHRASRDAVDAFVRHLLARVPEGEVFDVEGLLPVPDLRGGDIPAYQLYLTLAWLRSAGAIEKKGRDGYIVRDGSLGDGGLDRLWSSIPERKA